VPLVPALGDPPPEPSLDEAVAALKAGEPVVIPTDTVYGVAVDPHVEGATDRLFVIKRRPRDVPLAVLVADVSQALRLTDGVTPEVERIMERCWPGAVTLVVRRRTGLDLELGASVGTVGIRCPDHPVPLTLTRRVGPLATTSANVHGQATPPTPAAIAEALGDDLLVLDAGPIAGVPSTVLDVTGPEMQVLREGAVDLDVIRAAAGR
jgi:tRNA threonylcarbamoyl adenosine modification protein (Sua5/YciO/YrdC/YwlC family)